MNRRSFLAFMTLSPLGFLLSSQKSEAKHIAFEEPIKPFIHDSMEVFEASIKHILKNHPGKKFNILPADIPEYLALGVVIFREENGNEIAYHELVKLSSVKKYWDKKNKESLGFTSFGQGSFINHVKYVMSGHLNL